MIGEPILKSFCNSTIKEKKFGFFVSQLYILAAFPILPISIQSIVVGIFCIVSIVFYSQNFLNRLVDKKILFAILAIVSYYIFSLVSYIWSTDKLQYWNEIQPNICLLLLPISGLLFSPPIKSHLNNIFKIHILSLLIYIIGWQFYLLNCIAYYHNNITDSYSNLKLSGLSPEIISNKFLLYFQILKNFFFSFKTYTSVLFEVQSIKHNDWFQFHYTYIACLFLNGIFILYHLRKNINKQLFYIVLFAFISFILYQGSKINTFILLVALGLFILHLLPRNLSKTIFFFVLLVGFFMIFKNRDSFTNNSYVVYEKKVQYIDLIRKELYISAFKVFRQNPLIGVGIGDVKEEVNRNVNHGILVERNNEYVELGHKEKKNTHSQFLYYLAGTGLIGFILYSFYFLYFIYTDRLIGYLFCFACLILCNSIFENFLSRFFGSLIFVFFPTIYLNSKLVYENKRN